MHRAPPYIIPTPEFREQHIENGFLLLACDGLWDEMENEEAVSVVARLLRESGEVLLLKMMDFVLKMSGLLLNKLYFYANQRRMMRISQGNSSIMH